MILKIKNVKKINNSSKRYDIQVNKTNCFFANNILVHNSLINLYHDGDKWCIATSGTAYAEGETPLGETFYDLVCEALGTTDIQTHFSSLTKHYTYIFELTSPKNRVVTRYYETKLTLLAMRERITGVYENIYNDKKIAPYLKAKFNVELVETYNLNNIEDVLDFVESRSEMDEGVVCYDPKNEIRIKIKNSSWVAIHHLRGNETTLKSIITLLVKDDLSEYLSYFPEDLSMMQPYIDEYNTLKSQILNTYNKYKSIENQKDFALKVKDLPYSGFIFSLRKGKTIDELFVVDNLNMILKLFKGKGNER